MVSMTLNEHSCRYLNKKLYLHTAIAWLSNWFDVHVLFILLSLSHVAIVTSRRWPMNTCIIQLVDNFKIFKQWIMECIVLELFIRNATSFNTSWKQFENVTCTSNLRCSIGCIESVKERKEMSHLPWNQWQKGMRWITINGILVITLIQTIYV